MSMTTGRLLIKCLYVAGPKRLNSYKDIGEAAFGPYWRMGYIFLQLHYLDWSIHAVFRSNWPESSFLADGNFRRINTDLCG